MDCPEDNIPEPTPRFEKEISDDGTIPDPTPRYERLREGHHPSDPRKEQGDDV
jgi:hypothetical protein